MIATSVSGFGGLTQQPNIVRSRTPEFVGFAGRRTRIEWEISVNLRKTFFHNNQQNVVPGSISSA